MRLPAIQGLIRRRLLVNFRAEADVIGRLLPEPFRPKLHHDFAIVGICLIRLEQIRPVGLPRALGISSENAAHRMAVRWTDASGKDCEGVYIPRRDTGSHLNHLAGGRLFPGEHHLAAFEVEEDGSKIAMSVIAGDGSLSIRLSAREAETMPATSCFESLGESSAFFEAGSVGYSATADGCRLDGVRLVTETWQVRPLAVDLVESSFFSDCSVFPPGSIEFDHALIMREVPHRWHGVEDLLTVPKIPEPPAPDL